MDGVDLIICLAVWTLYKRRFPLTCDDFLASPSASRNKLRSPSLCGAIFRDFGAILKGFGRPKWMPKPIFWRLLFDVFFECVFAWIFGCFLEARNLKNHKKTLVFQWFLLIFRKSQFAKKYRKNVDFGVVFGGQNHEKSRKNGVENHVFFWH